MRQAAKARTLDLQYYCHGSLSVCSTQCVRQRVMLYKTHCQSTHTPGIWPLACIIHLPASGCCVLLYHQADHLGKWPDYCSDCSSRSLSLSSCRRPSVHAHTGELGNFCQSDALSQRLTALDLEQERSPLNNTVLLPACAHVHVGTRHLACDLVCRPRSSL